MSGEGSAFWLGAIVWGILFFCILQTAESICQRENDVADCEWTQNPFTPSVQK